MDRERQETGRESVIFSNGFIYRLGQRVKDGGERIGHTRLFGVHIFSLICRPMIALGRAIRDSALVGKHG
jgi:hypothetical protein